MAACAMTTRAYAVDISGVGAAHTCAAWADARHGTDANARVADEQWVLGYLSSAAFYNDLDIIKDLSADRIWAAMDQQCQAYPTANVWTAADKLFNALRERLPKADAH